MLADTWLTACLRGADAGVPQGKPAGLPYKWPLLADGQDPHALEARFAYHLQRLSIAPARLRKALGSRGSITTFLTQARVGISITFAHQLAEQLGVDGNALTRPLTDDEAQAWQFYRMSARNPSVVWQNARVQWEAGGLTQMEASRILGVPQSRLSQSLAGKRARVLDYQQVVKLLEAVSSVANPADLLAKN